MDKMIDLKAKKNLIQQQETKIAGKIASQIINKPKLSVWMILIPIVFIYYFYGIHRFTSGKKEFVIQFVKSRCVILDAALSSLETGEKVDFQNLAQFEKVPDNAIGAYIKWAKLLCEHYLKLLSADGDSYPDLVKSQYREQGRFLLILNQINKAESLFYHALRKEFKDTASDVGDVIKKLETSLGHLRRDEARLVFS